MKIKLATMLSADSPAWQLESYNVLRQSASYSRHDVTDNPDEADLILFSDCGLNQFKTLFNHPLYREYKHKCFAFSDHDTPFPILPGVYASIPRNLYDPSWTRSGFYSKRFICEYDPVCFNRSPELLFSFAGNCKNAPIRQKIKGLDGQNGRIIDVGNKTERAHTLGDFDQMKKLRDAFIEMCARSRFVLCPRGVGVSSMRLFEVMALGRCPVILSDGWVPPANIPWSEFSLTIPESEWEKIPELLEKYAGRAESFGLQARKIWEKHFSITTMFDTAVEFCIELYNQGRMRETFAHPLHFLKSIRGENLRQLLRGTFR
jgi:hypothetical protein